MEIKIKDYGLENLERELFFLEMKDNWDAADHDYYQHLKEEIRMRKEKVNG